MNPTVVECVEHDPEVLVVTDPIRVTSQLVDDPLVRRGVVPAAARHVDVLVIEGDPDVGAL